MMSQELNSHAERAMREVIQGNRELKKQHMTVKKSFNDLFDTFKKDKDQIENKLLKLKIFDALQSQAAGVQQIDDKQPYQRDKVKNVIEVNKNAYKEQLLYINNVEYLMKIVELMYFKNGTMNSHETDMKNMSEEDYSNNTGILTFEPAILYASDNTDQTDANIEVVLNSDEHSDKFSSSDNQQRRRYIRNKYKRKCNDESASLSSEKGQKRKRIRGDSYSSTGSSDKYELITNKYQKANINRAPTLRNRHNGSDKVKSLTPDIPNDENISVLSDITCIHDTFASTSRHSHFENSAGPSNIMRRPGANINRTVALTSALDHFDKCADQSKKMTNTSNLNQLSENNKENTLRNATPHVDESDSLPVVAPVAVQNIASVAPLVAAPVAAPVASSVAVPAAAPVVALVAEPVAVPAAAPAIAPVAVPVAVPVTAPGAAPEAQEETGKEDMVAIGSGRTLIAKHKYNRVEWKSYTSATRGLLTCIFTRDILATHSLTGKPSPAFRDRPAKRRLDKHKVADIIDEVKSRFINITASMIKSIITTKCADEAKMQRMRDRKSAVE